jgi:catechol 2,3-dioxygenase-like lactoylglutathione lyase family enzyme
MDHIGLSVADLDAAIDFYGRALGFKSEFPFELGRDEIRGVMMLHPSGLRLELFERPGAAAGIQDQHPIEALATRGYGHFALTSPTIDPVFEDLLAAGAREIVAPGPSPEPGIRMAFVADPEGNLVELVERPAAGDPS